MVLPPKVVPLTLRKPDRVTDRPALKRAGRRVTQYRRDHKLTLREFAERAGVSIGVVQTFEAGTRIPNVGTLAKLAHAAGFGTVAALIAEGPETVPGSDLRPDEYEVHSCTPARIGAPKCGA